MENLSALNEETLLAINGGNGWDVVKDVVGGTLAGAVAGAGNGAIRGLPLAPVSGGASVLGSATTGAVIGGAMGAGKAIYEHWNN